MVTFIKGILAGIALAVAGFAVPLSAEGLKTPTGEVLLTVTGDIVVRNTEDSAVFDLEMIRALDEVSFTTTTPWTDGAQEFTGVPLEALIRALGVEGGTLKATAINDYAIDIPLSDAVVGGPILAYLQNGQPMSVRDKGPLWLIYPYDHNQAYQSELIYSRSIWQLVRLDVQAD